MSCKEIEYINRPTIYILLYNNVIKKSFRDNNPSAIYSRIQQIICSKTCIIGGQAGEIINAYEKGIANTTWKIENV
jgi:hypothetical protein